MQDTRLNLPRLAFLLALGLASFSCFGESSATVPDDTAGKAASRNGTVLIELFTSQGCSSCPPADRLLTRLAADPRYAGRVVPLAFHVDYWNHLGWQDPFSSADWSHRQNQYAAAFRSRRIYTPQLVTNGRGDVVGSQEREVRAAIEKELAREPASRLALRVDPPAGGMVRVTVSAQLARSVGRESLEAWVALYQDRLSTPVRAGENGRSTLRNDRVVRELRKVFALNGQAGARGAGSVDFKIPTSWPAGDLGVAAFLQDPVSRGIEGAASRALVAPPSR